MIPKTLLFGIVLALAAPMALAAENQAPVVSNVTVSQREPCRGVFDILYDLADPDDAVCNVYVRYSRDGGATWNTAAHTSGDFGLGVACGTAKHVEWDLGKSAPGLVCQNVKIRVVADDGHDLVPMCFVPAGRFMTSSGVAVYMDDYWIDTYEVTNEFYCMFLNAGGNDDHYHTDMQAEIEITGPSGNYVYHPVTGFEKRPVRWVTWYDAAHFCDWRSVAEGLPAGSYKLPTEAQWEKAAGWGTPTRQSLWPYAFQSESIDCTKANYACGAGQAGHTTDVGSYLLWKSWYGCYDMSGNILEWCSDWYGAGYPSSTSNPTGPTTGAYRVLRGGSWDGNASTCRADYRVNYYLAPSFVGSGDGFRCARTP